MRKRLLLSLLALGIGVLGAMLSISLFFVGNEWDKRVQVNMRTQIDYSVKLLEGSQNVSAPSFAKTLSDIFDTRVSVFDFDTMKTIADSDNNSFTQMDGNMGAYTEVAQARNANVAMVVRREVPYGMTYNTAGIVTPPSGEKWILRLQTPKYGIIAFFSNPVPFAVSISLLIALVVGIAVVLYRRLMTPIAEIGQAVSDISQALPEEQYNNHIVVYGSDEIAQLATGFNAMIDYIGDMSLQLSQTNVEMKSILNAMTNGLLAVDSDFRIILINKCAMQLLGIHMEPDEALNRHFMDISLNVRIESFLKNAMEQESAELIQCETVLSPPDAERTIRMQISHLKYGSKIGGVVAMLDDVTQLRKLEKVRADFATNVSHEIKTPLTSIKGFIETLMAGAINDEQMSRKFLNIICLEADRLSRLIDDILNISRLESGDIDLIKEPISLNEQVNAVIEVMRPHAKDKDIHILFEEQAQDVYVLGNSDNVHQLLINLLDNAIKYSPPGKGIRIMLSYMAPNVLLRVVDNGFGIEKEHLDRLFERFYRVDKGRSRDKGGTGLGLAIVKHIVTSMGGHIQVASEVNIGTVFTVEFLARDRNGNPLGAKYDASYSA